MWSPRRAEARSCSTPVRVALLALATGTAAAQAGDAPPGMARYLPLYPAFHADAVLSIDPRDAVYDQHGQKRDTAAPSLAGKTSFPEQRLDATATWTFPLFEAAGVSFFDSRLHTARLHFGYANNRTRGSLATFARDGSDDARTDADHLGTGDRGVTDLGLEFGSWLLGSGNWRERQGTPYALLLLGGVRLPTGVYDRDSPTNPGSNTTAFHGQLGFYARPWSTAHLDAGAGYRAYLKNQDPAFGGNYPTNQGNDLFWDASFGQRLFSGVYLTAFVDGRDGKRNGYADVRFSPAAPPPPSTVPPSDNQPTPRSVSYDGGTSLIRAGLSLSGFIAQRWQLGLHYLQPLSGQSGEFDQPYSNRQPAGCTIGATGCQLTPAGTVRTDGLGPARAYASPSFALSLRYQFGQGDSYTCVGCRRP